MKEINRMFKVTVLTMAIVFLTIACKEEENITVIIDLDDLVNGSRDVKGQYTVNNGNILVWPQNAGYNDIVYIKGDGSNGFSINITTAQKIIIAENTVIKSKDGEEYAIRLLGENVVLHGEGDNISILGSERIYNRGGYGILANGNLIITGIIDNIQGGKSIGYNYDDNRAIGGTGIFAYGNIEISGSINVIIGGNGDYLGGHGISTTGEIIVSGLINNIIGGRSEYYRGGAGLTANENIIITGKIENITSGSSNFNISDGGIFSGSNVIISGMVGDIFSVYGFGIISHGNINISGLTGNIIGGFGGYDGIAATNSVTISGTTGYIKGGSSSVRVGGNGIEAKNVIIKNTATIAGVIGGDSNIDIGGYGIASDNNVIIHDNLFEISGEEVDNTVYTWIQGGMGINGQSSAIKILTR